MACKVIAPFAQGQSRLLKYLSFILFITFRTVVAKLFWQTTGTYNIHTHRNYVLHSVYLSQRADNLNSWSFLCNIIHAYRWKEVLEERTEGKLTSFTYFVFQISTTQVFCWNAYNESKALTWPYFLVSIHFDFPTVKISVAIWVRMTLSAK